MQGRRMVDGQRGSTRRLLSDGGPERPSRPWGNHGEWYIVVWSLIKQPTITEFSANRTMLTEARASKPLACGWLLEQVPIESSTESACESMRKLTVGGNLDANMCVVPRFDSCIPDSGVHHVLSQDTSDINSCLSAVTVYSFLDDFIATRRG